MSARKSARAARGRSVRWFAPSVSLSSTQYPGRNWVSPMTAQPVRILASTIGFSPRRAAPMRSARQSTSGPRSEE